MKELTVDRRQMLFGLAGTLALGGLPASASAVPHPLRAIESFQVRSSDGTMLAGDAQGDPAAPEIVFIHGLRQSRLSWDKQFSGRPSLVLRMV